MSAGAGLLNYALFSDVSRTLNWGKTVATETLAGTGNGSAQSLSVYGGSWHRNSLVQAATPTRSLRRSPTDMARRLLGDGVTAILGAMFATSCVSAQSLGISPVTLQIAPGQAATSLTVTNQGNRPTAIQLRVFAWNQDKGEDELIPTDQLIVSPPIATIAPSATQVVRLMLRRPASGKEASYRILLDQIRRPPSRVWYRLRCVSRCLCSPRLQHTRRRRSDIILNDATVGAGWSSSIAARATRRCATFT